MLNQLTARSLAAHIATGDITSLQATTAVLTAIDQLNPTLHAYNSVARDHAMQKAESVDACRRYPSAVMLEGLDGSGTQFTVIEV